MILVAVAALLAGVAASPDNGGASYVPGVGAYFQPYTPLQLRSARSPTTTAMGRAVRLAGPQGGGDTSTQMSHVSFPGDTAGEKCSFVQMKGE